MEEKRPGEYFPILEDEHGSYILNSKDMCLIDHIPELVQAGIDSFKIEGRVKTAYYSAVITGAYRKAVDLYAEMGEDYILPESIRQEVFKVSHRDYYTGFYFGETQGQYVKDALYIRDWDVCAMLDGTESENGAAFAVQKNRISIGDRVELLSPGKMPVDFTVEELYDSDMQPIQAAIHPQMRFGIRLPCTAPEMSIIRKANKLI